MTTKYTTSKAHPCRILAGNRVAIPKEIFKALDLKDGDLVIPEFDGKRLHFIPAVCIPRKAIIESGKA